MGAGEAAAAGGGQRAGVGKPGWLSVVADSLGYDRSKSELPGGIQQLNIARNESAVCGMSLAPFPGCGELQCIRRVQRKAVDHAFSASPDLQTGKNLAPSAPEPFEQYDRLDLPIGIDVADSPEARNCTAHLDWCSPPDRYRILSAQGSNDRRSGLLNTKGNK